MTFSLEVFSRRGPLRFRSVFSQDLAVMCRQLNMEDAVEEIMVQLGADDSGRISFDEFLHCRMRLITEIEQERLKERGLVGLPHWSSG